MEDFEWHVVHETRLLEAMVGHKPVGVNKYFQMALIWEKFTNSLNKDIDSSIIWSHLETLYSLEALDEIESLPFPNVETDFTLSDTEFETLLVEKKEDKDRIDERKSIQKGRETPKPIKEVKKDEKIPHRNSKDAQRRDSRDSKDSKSSTSSKKEVKKETEKIKVQKVKTSIGNTKEDNKISKVKSEEARAVKRPTRGSLKPDETSSGKASPVGVQQSGTKRRRI